MIKIILILRSYLKLYKDILNKYYTLNIKLGIIFKL